ncbi:hypothetical protein ABIA22_000335 [Sinorhizobium fredii]|uniref:hypothetical protein n=1 Tax=Rhizobium fredii TaxID=380 RepID=UPI003514B901
MSICKLTGKTGKFVKCHLIPKALTKPDTAGMPFTEFDGLQPKKVFSSWYDTTIVTREGEDVLADLDNWAIAYLRKSRLVWSGWGPVTTMADAFQKVPFGTGQGVREVEVPEPTMLKLFFLSLLWRAAVSRRPGFRDISLPEEEVALLTEALLSGDPQGANFFPTSLVQIYTLGDIHNHTPVMDRKSVPELNGVPKHDIDFVRFYFDGLVAHLNINLPYDGDGAIFVGTGKRLVVTGVPYEASLQLDIVDYFKGKLATLSLPKN